MSAGYRGACAKHHSRRKLKRSRQAKLSAGALINEGGLVSKVYALMKRRKLNSWLRQGRRGSAG